MRVWLTNARERKYYNRPKWIVYLGESTGKILEYNEDYYKYLRAMSVIRYLMNYEKDYMSAYDEVVFGIKELEK